MYTIATKYFTYSAVTFVLAYLSIFYLNLKFSEESKIATIIDDSVSSVSNYKWLYASLDIELVLSIFIPLALFALSVFFALKSIKSTSKLVRILSLIILTLAIFTPMSMIVVSAYLFFTIN